MSRPIAIATKLLVGATIIGLYDDDTTSENTLYDGDTVENLYYAKDGKVETVTGKANIKYWVKDTNRIAVDVGPTLAQSTEFVQLNVDASEKYAANIVEVPAQDILGIGDGDANKILFAVKPKVEITLVNSDKSVTEKTITEGDTGVSLTYKKPMTAKEVSGTFTVKALIIESHIQTNQEDVKVCALRLKNEETGEDAVVNIRAELLAFNTASGDESGSDTPSGEGGSEGSGSDTPSGEGGGEPIDDPGDEQPDFDF